MYISKNNNYTPSFQAFPVAKISTPKDKIILLQLEQNRDRQTIGKLLNSFLDGSIGDKFPNTLHGAMIEFMKNGFASINKKGVKSILSVKDGVPTGMINYSINDRKKEIYIDFLASWFPQKNSKVKNNGKMLIRHVYQEVLNNRAEKITLIPGFTSSGYYKKLGFKFVSDEAQINGEQVKSQIKNLNNIFDYTNIDRG